MNKSVEKFLPWHSPVKFATLLFLTALTSSCVSYQSKHPSSLPETNFVLDQTIENIIYSTPGWPKQLAGDLYLPRKSGLKPVVLMIHGGGWSGRSRDDMTTTSEKVARQGYAVFNISYRFTPEYVYPAQIQDVQLALRWLAQNADKYDLDLGRINAWGYSSGAHLAALIASIDPGDALTLPQTGNQPRIRSVVAGGIPANLSVYSESPIVIPLLGGNLREKPELYAQASPISHVSADDPPVFLYHGQLDSLVETEQSINYHKALQSAGVASELYLHRLWGHFGMFLFGWDAENRAIDFLNYYNT